MKFICTSDTHIHPFRECSRDNGLDRLCDALRALQQTLQIARERQCLWFFLGDLKHVKGLWYQAALNGVIGLMEEYHDVPKVMVAGNHDGPVRDGVTGLAPFVKYARVIERPSIIPLDEPIAVWPYNPDIDILHEFVQKATQNSDVKILMAHAFLHGSRVGPTGVALRKGFTLEDFGLHKHHRVFEWGFFGDVHLQQQVTSCVFYPGSPLAQNWGELELNKGCLFVDTKKKLVEPIVLTGLPRFRVIEAGPKDLVRMAAQNMRGWASGDFVKLIVDGSVKQEDVQPLLSNSMARFFQVVARRTPTKVEERAAIHTGMDPRTLLSEYMKIRPVDGLDAQMVLSAGLRLLAE